MGCIAALTTPLLVNAVVVSSRYLGVNDVLSDYLFGIGWAALLGFSILLWPVPSQHKRILLLLWLARCLVTLGFMLWYEYHYAAMDARGYFFRALQMEDGWGALGDSSGTSHITGLVWLHHQFLPDSYHGVKVTFSMVGLISTYTLYRAAVLFLQRDVPHLLYVLGLYPSILLWSSLLGKDPIVTLGISFYAYGVIGQYRHRNVLYVLLIALGVVIATWIRPWMALILVAPLITFALFATQGLTFKVIFSILFIAGVSASFNLFTERFQLETTQDVLNRIETVHSNLDIGGSASKVDMKMQSLNSVFAYLPFGMFTALFRPLPGEVRTLFGSMAGVENGVLLILVMLAVKRSRLSDLWNPIVLWALSLIVIWAGFYAFVSYNLGTAVRYRLQVLPILICVILYFAQKKIRAESGIQQQRFVQGSTQARLKDAGT
ncbi:MAG: hypothetical protein HC884_06915 [Chloroflexaceae bacterium]|nr:hypothetical protein [Chloroflexaceae bacterium]